MEVKTVMPIHEVYKELTKLRRIFVLQVFRSGPQLAVKKQPLLTH